MKNIRLVRSGQYIIFHDVERHKITSIKIDEILIHGISFDFVNQKLVSSQVLIDVLTEEEARRVVRDVFDLLASSVNSSDVRHIEAHPAKAVQKRRRWPWILAGVALVAGVFAMMNASTSSSSTARDSQRFIPQGGALNSAPAATSPRAVVAPSLPSDPLMAETLPLQRIDDAQEREPGRAEDDVVRFGTPRSPASDVSTPYVFRPKVSMPEIKAPELNCD